MSQKYLMTMALTSIEPHYHGVVEINDAGILDDGTPVEDYGCFYMSDDPIPTTRQEMFDLFLSLM